MTALGGFVTTGPVADCNRRCAAILANQAEYGSLPPQLTSVDGATLGIVPHPLLPGDAEAPPLIANERYLIAADIRLDNRGEIARACGLPADVERHTDAQILLFAWTRCRDGCLERLIGDYAIAVFDRVDRSLTLARDPSGQRPLFYAVSGNGFAFASMPSGLHLADARLRSWNMPAVARALLHSDNFGQDSYFTNSRRVELGQCVTMGRAGQRTRAQWQPDLSRYSGLSLDDSVQQYRELLDLAVTSRMRRDSGKVAVHLSSGYDSSAVAATAAMHSRPPRCSPSLLRRCRNSAETYPADVLPTRPPSPR